MSEPVIVPAVVKATLHNKLQRTLNTLERRIKAANGERNAARIRVEGDISSYTYDKGLIKPVNITNLDLVTARDQVKGELALVNTYLTS